MRRFGMRLGRRGAVAAGVAVLAVASAAASLGPVVRARVDRAAARAGATVAIGAVRPTWSGLELRDVGVELADVPDVRIALDAIAIDGLTGERTISVRGGTVVATGEPATLASQVGALRARLAGDGGQEASTGRATRIAAEGLRARWSRSDGAPDAIRAEGVRVGRSAGGGLELGIDEVTATVGGASGSARGLDVALVREHGATRVARLVAREATIGVAAPAADPEGPAAPPATGAGPAEVRAPGPWRAPVAALARALDTHVTSDAPIVIEALSVAIRAHDEVVSVGPGRFELQREAGPPRRLVLEVAQGSDEAATRKLAVRVTAPFGDGSDGAPLALEIHGGPIPLAALGVRDGELGLVEPERAQLEADATVELDDARGLVRFRGEGRVKGLAVRHAAIAEQPVRGIDLGFRGDVEAELDRSAIRVAKGELQLGALRVLGGGEVRRRAASGGRPDDWSVDLRWEVPLVPCQALLDAAPTGLLPLVAGSTMAGSLALEGTAKLDTAQLDRTYAVTWDASVGCRMVAPRPQVAVERFLKPFKKAVYTPEGRVQEAEFGPGTPGWTPGSRITHLMSTAVVTAEDGRFERHGGFDHEAIRNSIRENVRARRFVRGASTISMQLAKNLYLPRDKTLSRKLEEAVLTLYLEQALTKEQLMELYLNVVEFGPNVYGIGPAAQHYFRTSPAALSVSQCFYLASILPSPKKQHFAAGGAVSAGWMKHLRRLMKYAHHRGRLTDVELDEGLTEVPVFGSPQPIREMPEGEGTGDDEAQRREPWADDEGRGDG